MPAFCQGVKIDRVHLDRSCTDLNRYTLSGRAGHYSIMYIYMVSVRQGIVYHAKDHINVEQ